jgi:uncharacterized protein (DUF2147 family)
LDAQSNKRKPGYGGLLFVIFCLLMTGSVAWSAGTTGDPVAGLWRTEGGEGVVELYPCDGSICGRFYWLKDDSLSDVSRDTENPDSSRRDRPLCRMQFMGGFTPGDNGRYNGGWVYSPRSGSTYTARMTLADHDTLNLHGYVLTPFLGESQIWKRVSESSACTTALP